MQGNDLISIIVPVYNVEDYLEQCIQSIIEQTYTNLEILLINDGSEDHSEQICLKWAREDKRIVYVYKKNETLGPTRNLGIQMARGKYIAFVDSDDWIDSRFIEKLYACMIAENCDFVRCDYYRVKASGMAVLNNNEYYPFEQANIHKMIGSTQAITIWTGLYLKELWIRNEIKMPPGPHQDLAILGLTFLSAKKIGVCREGLYFYREDRTGNTTQKVLGSDSILNPLKYLVGEYKRRGLFDEYREELLQVCTDRLNTSINKFRQGKENASKQEYVENIKTFLQKEFNLPDSFLERKMIAVGGYDLQRVLSKSFFHENIEEFKYQHSSIISMMSDGGGFYIEPEESYRGKMIEADRNKKLKFFLQNHNLDYILIDFMEERYDILDFGNNGCLTYSDALKERDIQPDTARVIRRDSKECADKWRSSCLQFIKLLKRSVDPRKVFLIKFFLAERYGEYGKEDEYEEIEQIRKINGILGDYYTYFEENFMGINVITLNSEYCYTDKGMRYGCYPWHLNSNAQYDIQSKINHYMRGGERA